MFFNGYISFGILEMYKEEEPDNIEDVIKLFNCWKEKEISNQELYNYCIEKYDM
jgi:hypothetical protein